MLRVGLTGGIGSGKSTVAALFARQGVPVVDADEIARALTMPGLPAHAEIVVAFGRDIVDVEGRIDRTKLRQCVFSQPTQRARLEAILHPRIRAEIAQRTQALDAPYCLVVVPLLIEAGFRDLVDRVLLVDADADIRLARTVTRTGMAQDEIRAIMATQINREERLKNADDVIVNNSDLAHLEREATRLHERYHALATSTV